MATSITLLFPGQGSQKIGMGTNFNSNKHYNLLDTANNVLGFDIKKIITDGPEDELKLTYNAQPAILSYSMILYRMLTDTLASYDITINRVLGHSLGEYSALCAASSLSFEQAVKAVNIRGKIMQETALVSASAMVAIMKVPSETIIKACEIASEPGSEVMPANFNEPNQIVISGSADACDRATKWLAKNIEGRLRAIPLKVSAPFHSSYMLPAAQKLKTAFNDFEFRPNKIPYIANIDANEYGAGTDIDSIKNNLIAQVTGSVLWTQSIKKLPKDTLCIEVGPGKVLTGLVKKINPELKVITLDKDGSFDELKEILS